MPKFRKKCSNPFHNEWNIEEIDVILVVVRTYGVAELLGAFKSLATIKGLKAHKVEKICTSCLKQCLRKRNFTRHLPARHDSTLQEKVCGFLPSDRSL